MNLLPGVPPTLGGTHPQCKGEAEHSDAPFPISTPARAPASAVQKGADRGPMTLVSRLAITEGSEFLHVFKLPLLPNLERITTIL